MRRLLLPFLLFALLLSGLVAGAGGTPAGAAGGHRRPNTDRYAVIIVLDGGRPGYFNLARMPHLRALMARGVTYTQAFVGQLLANTPPSHATIGTGMFPAHHGVEGFLWEDPRTHAVFNPAEINAVLAGQLEAVIRNHHVPTLAGRIERAYPGAQTVSVAGHKCYAADALGTPSATDILCALIYHNRWVAQAVGAHRPPPGAINNPAYDVPIPPRTSGFGAAVQQWKEGGENAWTMRYALWAVRRIHVPRLLMINLSETDVLGHFSRGSATARYLMNEFDGLLGRLEATYRREGILNRTDIVITADHGMSPITRHISYHVLSGAVADAGATPVYIEHDTAAAIGLTPENRDRAVAINVFRRGGTLVDATYYKQHTRSGWSYHLAAAQRTLSRAVLHAYRVLADTAAADSGPGVLAIFAPHASTRALDVYGYRWDQGHLGPQWDDQHIPLIIAGPGVRHGVRSSYPARLVDIAPTIEYLLGANSAGADGVVLADGLSIAGVARRAAETRRGRALLPVVKAIETRWRQG